MTWQLIGGILSVFVNDWNARNSVLKEGIDFRKRLFIYRRHMIIKMDRRENYGYESGRHDESDECV